MTRSRALRRLVTVFLPHTFLLLATIATTVLYAGTMTARIALLYPVSRIFVQELSQAEREELGLPADEGVEHTLMRRDGKFSDALKKVNYYLDGFEKTMVDALPDWWTDDMSAVTRAKVGTLCTVILLFAIIALLAAFSSLAKIYFKSLLVVRVLVSLRVKLLENLLHQPLAFYNEQKRGELITRMSSDVQASTICLHTLAGDMLQQPALILAPVFVLWAVNWWLVFFPIVFLAIIMLSLKKQTRKVHRRAKARQRTVARVNEAMVQMFSGIRVVKAFGLEREKVAEYTARNEDFARNTLATEVSKAWTRTLMELLVNAALLILLFVGMLFIGGGASFSPAIVVALLAFMAQIYRPSKMLTRSYADLQDNLAGAARTFEFIDLPHGMPDRRGAIPVTDVVGTLRFEDVSFAYNGNGRVLEHVNLEVPAGQVVALVGHSGAGKSTLANLVPRFYDPNEGEITLDGTDIREFKRESLLRHLAIVTQEPFLFNTTVRENILHGNHKAPQRGIEEAAKAAHIHDFILSLPAGYDTVVGEQGANLSGGQRQRITIARALLRDPTILILDEATSSLDSESEHAVQKALNNLMSGRTTLVIAHRLSTIQHADKICVLQDGRIAEMGTHDQLMSQDSLYRRLYKLQFARD